MTQSRDVFRRSRIPLRALLIAVVIGVGIAGSGANNPVPALAATQAPTQSAGTATPGGTLVLYDDRVGTQWDYFGELYGAMTANLVSRFGRVTTHPVEDYVAGEMAGYQAVVYLGNSYRDPTHPLSLAFLDEVLAGNTPVLWQYFNIWELQWRYNALHPQTSFQAQYGFVTGDLDSTPLSGITYLRNGRTFALERDAENPTPLVAITVTDPAKSTVLATATPVAAGPALNWAVRAANLTYVADEGLSYISEENGYLAFCDLLIATVAPNTPERHRALVRLEDVSPASDPVALRSIADLLESEGVPFSMHVIPTFVDAGLAGHVAQRVELADRPEMVSALRYVTQHGGRLVMHGDTHQLGTLANPYSGISGDDFEFFRAHVNPADNFVIFDGPVDGDSVAWSGGRLDEGLAKISAVGLPRPRFFTTPHYFASTFTYEALRQRFEARYERSLYYIGVLQHGVIDHAKYAGQFFPWAVTDVYGSSVIPESLGNETQPYNQHPGRTPQDIVDSANANLAIRDGVASFFWHPWLVGAGSIEHLRTIVRGIKAAGFTFVTPDSLLLDLSAPPATTIPTPTLAPTTTPTTRPPTTVATPPTVFNRGGWVPTTMTATGSGGVAGPPSTIWRDGVGPVRPLAPSFFPRPGLAHFVPEVRGMAGTPNAAAGANTGATGANPGTGGVADAAIANGPNPTPVIAIPNQAVPQPVVAVPVVSSPSPQPSSGGGVSAASSGGTGTASPVIAATPPTPQPQTPSTSKPAAPSASGATSAQTQPSIVAKPKRARTRSQATSGKRRTKRTVVRQTVRRRSTSR
jgi:uncharacterized protein YdaL